MRLALLAFYNETRKGMLLIWDYRFSMLTQVLMFGGVFLAITYMIGNGHFVAERMAPILVGYMVWSFASMALNDMSWNLMEETRTGTLEQMYMTPAPTGLIVLGRAFSRLLFAGTMVLILSVGIIAGFGLDLPLRWPALPVLVLTVAGVYGFGFIVAGATLVFKQVGTLAFIIQNSLLFLNGSFFPVDRFPPGLATFAKTLPTTQGIIVLRQVLVDRLALAEVWSDGTLILLVAHSAVFLVGGWTIFKWCENIARRQGSLGQY